MPKKTVVAIALAVVGLVLGSSIAVAMNLGILASTSGPDHQSELGVEVDPELTVATATPEVTGSLTTPTALPDAATLQDAPAIHDSTIESPSADERAKVGASYDEYDAEDDDYYDTNDEDSHETYEEEDDS